MGEGFGFWKLGDDARLTPSVQLANVASGFHVSDFNQMRATVALAKQHGVKVGAHPSLPDLPGFGRREMHIGRQELANCLIYQIGALAAESSTHVQYTRIEVNGHTDTSGTPSYNMALSLRRAHAVAGELVRDGVPAMAISIRGFGKTNLLVPTGPGVREPQNRRVEIVIS